MKRLILFVAVFLIGLFQVNQIAFATGGFPTRGSNKSLIKGKMLPALEITKPALKVGLWKHGGEQCQKDKECFSKICDAESHTCLPDLGDACDDSRGRQFQCATGTCWNKVCLPEDIFTRSCRSDRNCRVEDRGPLHSWFSYENAFACIDGRCKLLNGAAACQEDNQCVSGRCGSVPSSNPYSVRFKQCLGDLGESCIESAWRYEDGSVQAYCAVQGDYRALCINGRCSWAQSAESNEDCTRENVSCDYGLICERNRIGQMRCNYIKPGDPCDSDLYCGGDPRSEFPMSCLSGHCVVTQNSPGRNCNDDYHICGSTLICDSGQCRSHQVGDRCESSEECNRYHEYYNLTCDPETQRCRNR